MRGVKAIYDTVGSPETIEVGVRILQPHGKLVVTGVANPARFEWTPLYFKEIEVLGSNAFGLENLRWLDGSHLLKENSISFAIQRCQ